MEKKEKRIENKKYMAEVMKRAVDLLIGDIRDNEWYCIQGDSESEMLEREKALIVAGLKSLIGEE